MESEILGTAEAAKHLGMAKSSFARWVWSHPDASRRCKPVGYVGRSPYWTREALDGWRRESYRGPGRPPLKAE